MLSAEYRKLLAQSDRKLNDLNRRICQYGFDSLTLQNIEEVAIDIDNGTTVFERIPQEQLSGLSARYGVLCQAAIICRGCPRTESESREIYCTDDLAGDGVIQQSLIEEWAKRKGVWFDNAEEYLQKISQIRDDGTESAAFFDIANQLVRKLISLKYNHCCVDNMPRCFMDVAQTLVTTDRRGDVYVNWYSDFEASIDGVQIKVGGNYPMDSKVSVKVSCEGKRNVSLRVPSWCEKMTVDGVESTGRWFCCAINSNHTFEIEFLMNFEVVRPNRQTIENYGHPDFRKDRWICGDKDLLPYLRKSPCYQIVRGPVIFAKSIYVGDTGEQIFHTTPLDKDIKVVEMNRIDVPEVWGAWAVTLSDGTMVNVCDYGSACDTRHKERGYQFSVYF